MGGAAIALIDGRIVFVGGRNDGKIIAGTVEMRCITALCPARGGALLVANGSASNGPLAYKRDLMEKNASGSVWRIEPDGARTQLARSLAYPYGLLEEADSVVISERWRCALTRISSSAGPQRARAGKSSRLSEPLVTRRRQCDLARTACAAKPARRIRPEREPLPPPHAERNRSRLLIASCLRAGHEAQEPTQQSGVRQLGVLKPWAPTRSYGLAACLDTAYRPVASLHSRANGRRHGVTSCLGIGGRLFFCAKGDGVVASCG